MNEQLFLKLTSEPNSTTPADVPNNLNSPEGDSWCHFLIGLTDLRVLAMIPGDVADKLAEAMLDEYHDSGSMFLPDAWSLDVSPELKTRLVDEFLSNPTNDGAKAVGIMLEGNKFLPGGNATPADALAALLAAGDKIVAIDLDDINGESILSEIFANLACPPEVLTDVLSNPCRLPFQMPPDLLSQCQWMAAGNPSTPVDAIADLLLSNKADQVSWMAALHNKKTPKSLAAAWYAAINVPQNAEFVKKQWEFESCLGQAVKDIKAILGA